MLLLFFALFNCQYFAQTHYPGAGKKEGAQNSPGSVTGTIVDSLSGKKIGYASIGVYKENSNKTVSGVIANADGEFLISNLPHGKYKMKITFMGYNAKNIDSIIISDKTPSASLGLIGIGQKSLQIQGVEVTASRNPIEIQVDKMVVSVEKTLPAAGGSVIDVLKNTPSVSVDVDNNVSLRGNSNITFLLDGKPSGSISASMLEQIPASAIENIEIVTNPSAKYDADGSAGIINLVMKKHKEMNWNGMLQANAGTKDNYGSSVNFNYKKDDFNIYGSYDDRFNHRSMSGNIYRETNSSAGTSYLEQQMSNDFHGSSHNFKTGIDYSFDDKNSISASVLYNTGKRNNSQNQNADALDSVQNLVSNYVTKNRGNNNGESFDYLLSYKKVFTKPGHELTSDLYYTRSTHDEDNSRNITYSNLADPALQNTYSANANKLFSFKADYVQPFSESDKFEAGYKVILRNRDINYNVFDYNYTVNDWINDLTQSNAFLYKEQIHAAYVMYSGAYAKLKYQVGLRLEEALTKSVLNTEGNEREKDYFSPIPTIHFSQELADGHELKLSYSRRLNRPQMQLINPFIRYNDPQNAFVGNPYLKPEYTDSYEFGYNYFHNSSSIFTNLFFKQVNDNINSISKLIDNNVTLNSYSNIDKQISYGVEVNGFHQLLKWWSINGGVSYYASKFEGDFPGAYSSKTSDLWNARLMTIISFGWDVDFQFNGFYASKNITPQGETKSMFFSDVALKKSLLDKKMSISLRVSDPFKSIKFRNETYGTNFYNSVDFRPSSQIFSLSVTYNLNNFKNIFDKKPDEDNGTREYEDNGQQR